MILPAARIGAHATVGPASLVMRGEERARRQPLERQPDRSLARRAVADYHAQVR